MDDTSRTEQQVLRIRAMVADVVVELQRADGKATAVCGVAGGLLAVGVGTLAGMSAASPVVVAALLWASVVMGAAVGAALWALRPVLPRSGSPEVLLSAGRAARTVRLVASLSEMGAEEQLRVERERLVVLANLARGKFLATRVAVDLVMTALAVAGMGLLIPYMAA
ncbi:MULTISPECIES: hypothetical protein [Streptomyces]|uniref:hypothetical protein n=1 Tax=Streptomyces TaxID=1883 RepID=UPI0036CEDAEC